MRELSKTQNLIFRLGALLMLLGAGTYLIGGVVSNVVFAVGVTMFVAMQLNATYEGRNFVVARLRRQQLMGGMALVLAAVAMTAQSLGHNLVRYNEWVVCLLIGAVVQLYTAFRIPQELEKERTKKGC